MSFQQHETSGFVPPPPVFNGGGGGVPGFSIDNRALSAPRFSSGSADNNGNGNRHGNHHHSSNGNYHNNNSNHRGGRGGGRGRGFNGRGSGGRGSGGGGGDKPRIPGNMVPRRIPDINPRVKVARDILTRLGDYSANTADDDIVSSIKVLCQIFAGLEDLVTFADEISQLFIQCLSSLSMQTAIYSTLLSMLNLNHPEFVCLVVHKIEVKYLQALREDDVPTAKLLLRSIACMASSKHFRMEGAGGFIDVLTPLFSSASNSWMTCRSSNGSISDSGQTSLYLLASTVPWVCAPLVGTELHTNILNLCDAVCTSDAGGYKSAFDVGGTQRLFHSAASASGGPDDTAAGADLFKDPSKISVGPGSIGGSTVAAYDSLWEACHICRVALRASAAGVALPACLFAPWIALENDLLYGSDMADAIAENAELLATAPKRVYNMLSFSADNFATEMNAILAAECIGSLSRSSAPNGAPLGLSSSSNWLFARFELFRSDTSPEAAVCCALSNVEKYIAFSYFSDILKFFDPIINEDGTKLGSIELQVKHLLAVFQLFPADSHLEFILVEALFQRLLQQPVNAAVTGGIYRLILSLCKVNAAFPAVVALGTNILFQMVPDMDTAVWREFGRWFAFHLVNSKLAWPFWDFWVEQYEDVAGDVTVSDPSRSDGLTSRGCTPAQPAMRLFCKYVVEKISRSVVVRSKLEEALPAAFHTLIPPLEEQALSAICPLLVSSAPTTATTNAAAASADSTEEDNGGIAVDEASAAPAPVPVLSAVAALLQDDVGDEEPHTLRQLARKLVYMINEKTPPDDLIDWLETVALSMPADASQGVSARVVDAETSNDMVEKGVALLQAILSVGASTQTLYGAIGLLDRYCEPLRIIAATDMQQKALLQTLAQAFANDAGHFAFVLDEMLRRDQINVAVAAQWLVCVSSSDFVGSTSSQLPIAVVSDCPLWALDTDLWVYVLAEQLVDRGIDFVKAAVSRRMELNEDFSMDESAELEPADYVPPAEGAGSMGVADGVAESIAPAADTVAAVPAAPTDGTEQVDYDEEEEEDEDEQGRGRRTRMRKDEDGASAPGATGDVAATGSSLLTTMGGGDFEEEAPDGSDDPLWVATEAAKSSIANARDSFAWLGAALLARVALNRAAVAASNSSSSSGAAGGGRQRATSEDLSEENDTASPAADEEDVSAVSLLNRTLRAYIGAERYLSSRYNRRVVLAAGLALPSAGAEGAVAARTSRLAEALVAANAPADICSAWGTAVVTSALPPAASL